MPVFPWVVGPESGCILAPPSGENYAFAIVDVGGGRPFASNSCSDAEASAATGDSNMTNVALYFNTGYGRNINSACANDAIGCPSYSVFNGIKGVHALSAAQKAWEIGCSEALYAKTKLPAVAPTMWWADVETDNSWSTNTSVNDALSYAMQAGVALRSFYSYTSAWNKIAGQALLRRQRRAGAVSPLLVTPSTG